MRGLRSTTVARRRGAVLIEFALISLVLYLLIAAALTFGSVLWIGQGLQQAVDVTAQELARLPLPPAADLGWGERTVDVQAPGSGYAAGHPRVLGEIYDEQYLVITPAEISAAGFSGPGSLLAYADAQLPLLNRLLVPQMIFDRRYAGGVWRYPGAIVINNSTGEETVLVPRVQGSQVTWLSPVEEIRVDHDADPATPPVGSFSVLPPVPSTPGLVPGVVSIRIHYPFQSAAMSGFDPGDPEDPDDDFDPNLGLVIAADDDALTVESAGIYELLVPAGGGPDGQPATHAGQLGLGRQVALPFDRDSIRTLGVRPYRRVISVQAVHRREIFE